MGAWHSRHSEVLRKKERIAVLWTPVVVQHQALMYQAKELAIAESRCEEASSQIEDDLLKLRHSIHAFNKCARLGRYHLKCRNEYSAQFSDSEFKRKYDYNTGKVKHIVLNVENFLRRAKIRSALMRRRQIIQMHSMQLRSADRCLRSKKMSRSN